MIPAPQQPPVDFMPSGGGGGNPGADTKVKTKQRKTMNSTAPRVAAAGAASQFTLPEPTASDINALSSLSGGALSGGLGGSGSGGGRGSGTGTGFGAGTGPGMGGGTGKMNPFGMLEPANNALVGTFYDLKQTKNGKPSDIGAKGSTAQVRGMLRDFVKRGWNERQLSEYFQAPQKLYQTKIFMPTMTAEGAPKAFGQDNIAGSRWAVVYRGSVTPPKTGKYRFVGAGDDVLTIRFNGKTVFDYGYESVTADQPIIRNLGKVTSTTSEDKKWRRDMAIQDPPVVHSYASLAPNHRKEIGGLAVGLEFDANANTNYPIEILISEIPGGKFFAYLLIEEVGVQYSKDPSGAPILPLFRLDNTPPAETNPGPPFDSKAPAWKLGGNRGRPSI